MKRAIGSPSAADGARFAKIHDIGCIACRLNGHYREPCEIHHINIGGKHGAPNLGHDYTIGLCAWHHRGILSPWKDAQTIEFERGPSFARSPSSFRERVCRQLSGTDCDALLLQYQNQLIGE